MEGGAALRREGTGKGTGFGGDSSEGFPIGGAVASIKKQSDSKAKKAGGRVKAARQIEREEARLIGNIIKDVNYIQGKEGEVGEPGKPGKMAGSFGFLRADTKPEDVETLKEAFNRKYFSTDTGLDYDTAVTNKENKAYFTRTLKTLQTNNELAHRHLLNRKKGLKEY